MPAASKKSPKKNTGSKKSSPKSGQKSAQKQSKPQEGAVSTRGSDILGVVLIALGVLLGLYIYKAAEGWVGQWLVPFLGGSFGIFSYALPVLFAVLGILTIASRKSARYGASKPVTVICIAFVVALIHLISRIPYQTQGQNTPLGEYISSVWELGKQAKGGGFIGGIICYVLQIIGGDSLGYVVIIAVLLIGIMLLTRISLKTFADMFRENVSHALDRSQDEEYYQPTVEQSTPKKSGKLYTLSIDDEQKLKKGRRKKKQIPFDEAFTVPQQEPVEKSDEGATFMPTSGKLAKKSSPEQSPKKPEPKQGMTDSFDFEPAQDSFFMPPKTAPAAPAEPAEPSIPVENEFDIPIDPIAAEPMPIELDYKQNLPANDSQQDNEELELAASELPVYIPPSLDYLNRPKLSYSSGGESPQATARLLEQTLANFNISAKVINIAVGPVVTRYELQPAPGIRVNRITTLSNDIALALAARRVRIEAPIPGKAAIGVEIPNKDAVTVVLRDIIDSDEFKNASSPTTMALGKDIGGKVMIADLAKMPHMLIAGSTGSGKSVCINDLIISMIYKSSPQQLRLILIDPKMVELSVFATLPHLLIPVVTEPKKASSALRWAVNEMTLRYKKFSELGTRDLARYNELQSDEKDRLPTVVVIIDELADLMMVAPDEVEDSICRVAQLGRAAGIHLIVATQRPSADVITGLIKANIPSRCAFAVSSSIDSRIILDATGAEKLLGRGDMLFHPNGAGKPTRLQCAFVSDEEVERISSHFEGHGTRFDQKLIDDLSGSAKGGPTGGVFGEGKQEDELLGEAVRIVLQSGQASISMIQRRLRVGYARAARLIDIMEQHGYVSGFDGSKPRKVKITRAQFEQEFGEPVGGDEPEPPAVETEQ